LGVGGSTRAAYTYNGTGQLIKSTLNQPNVFSTLDGSTPETYTNLDRFDRTIGSVWKKGSVAFYSVNPSYDRDSNITDVTDNVNLSAAPFRNFDVMYDIDGVNRVTKADEGAVLGEHRPPLPRRGLDPGSARQLGKGQGRSQRRPGVTPGPMSWTTPARTTTRASCSRGTPTPTPASTTPKPTTPSGT
jgi:hypothetical protein